MSTAFTAFRSAAAALAPRTAVVLGSGLGGATAGFTPASSVGYADVPGLVPPTIAGHRGQLAVGHWHGVPVLICFGRVHFYEGHPWDRVTQLVRHLADLGVRRLLLTNAAGGIHPSLQPGSVMAIRAHLKWLDREAWQVGGQPLPPTPSPKQGRGAGAEQPSFSPPRFGEGLRLDPRGSLVSDREGLTPPPNPLPEAERGGRTGSGEASSVLSFSPPRFGEGPGEGLPPYSPRLVALLQQLESGLLAGTYAALTGPCYETPAEIRALRTLGADAVGMSTAIEAETAAALGMEVAGLSSITNKAAGLSDGPLSHKEVEECARDMAAHVGALIGKFVGAC